MLNVRLSISSGCSINHWSHLSNQQASIGFPFMVSDAGLKVVYRAQRREDGGPGNTELLRGVANLFSF